jgi:hypothetical protein
VDIRITENAKAYISAHGGTVFVRSHPHHCCTGTLTLLDVTTAAPRDLAGFQAFDAGGVGVQFCGGSSGHPGELAIELRGLIRRHPVAYWDGCAFKM